MKPELTCLSELYEKCQHWSRDFHRMFTVILRFHLIVSPHKIHHHHTHTKKKKNIFLQLAKWLWSSSGMYNTSLVLWYVFYFDVFDLTWIAIHLFLSATAAWLQRVTVSFSLCSHVVANPYVSIKSARDGTRNRWSVEWASRTQKMGELLLNFGAKILSVHRMKSDGCLNNGDHESALVRLCHALRKTLGSKAWWDGSMASSVCLFTVSKNWLLLQKKMEMFIKGNFKKC